jgi:hypothetical protein
MIEIKHYGVCAILKMTSKKDNTDQRLNRLEAVIETNQRSFYQLGKALKEIRDSGLYQKLCFESFEQYIKIRWDLGKSHCYRLIEASDVIDNLSPIGESLPQNESQVRPLTKLDAFDQRKVWQAFIKSGVPLSAVNISKFISAYIAGPEAPAGSTPMEIISQDYLEAVKAVLYQIRIARNDRWRSTCRQAALYWNAVMKEKILWESETKKTK